ncbi:protein of unknown function [Ruminococcaceae bacterium BL-6]|nr:protein of unknown function [Ruminococcaceae bacterium BL-6]
MFDLMLKQKPTLSAIARNMELPKAKQSEKAYIFF